LTCPPKTGPGIMLECGPKKGGIWMVRRSYRPEQIINKLREAEVLLSQGSTVGEVARKIGVTEQTYLLLILERITKLSLSPG